MRSLRRTLFLAGLVLAAAALAGVAQPRFARTASTPADRTITVTGDGTATTVPDRAAFQFGVTTKAATATDALTRNSQTAAAVIAALESAGLPTASLQTAGVSLSPQTSQDGTRIIGYTATNSVNATMQLAKAGAAVDAAVGAGADSVSGPGLDTSDRDALYRDALEQAFAAAKAKASALADAAGLQLGAVQTMSEGGGSVPVPITAAPAAGASVPIAPGTQEIDATVTVTFAVS
jgi:uncharacterized protein YggE